MVRVNGVDLERWGLGSPTLVVATTIVATTA